MRTLATIALLSATAYAADPVSIAQDDKFFTLSNGYLTAQVNKTTGDLTSLKVQGIETMGYRSGHHAGYWEQNPAKAAHLSARITIDPASNGGARGEVSILGISDGKPLDGGEQPGGAMLCDLEIRYTLGREEHGLYTYAIFSHRAAYGATSIGESRFGVKLSGDVFDWMSIDARRNRLMPSGADWDDGAPLNMKEARRLTTGLYAGQVEHKYDYSALQFDIPAFGWSSTKKRIGFYFINPSMEYLSGGATKVELTGHLDNGDGGDPTLLDYWRGTHYGGSILPLDAGEEWSKVVGPILIYVNSGADPEGLYRDALGEAGRQAALWPYSWVQGVDYPKKEQRATVTGQIALHDPQAASMRLPHLLVGLAYPEHLTMEWQNDAKHYQFWTRGTEDGRFAIPNVRAGEYELHAIADGVLGEFTSSKITLREGQRLDLGTLEWKPVRYGRQVWEIGIPNRSGGEFFKGDDYFHWGWYLQYPRLFPDDVSFEIGKSDYQKDWFFEQVPHAEQDDPTGRGRGRATTWTVKFTLPQDQHGTATLRLAIAGAGARSIDVRVNGQLAGSVSGIPYNATINRDGIQGRWLEKDVSFDADLLKEGSNSIALTIPAGGLTNGIIYDYVRLEVSAQ
jgi:rhamnogalacturonan endolyase